MQDPSFVHWSMIFRFDRFLKIISIDLSMWICFRRMVRPVSYQSEMECGCLIHNFTECQVREFVSQARKSAATHGQHFFHFPRLFKVNHTWVIPIFS
jgi:hypothetical protein